MNREIKFRAWVNTDDGDEMVMLDKLNLDNGLWFNYTEKHINEHISLMQFTGLTDKNGVTYCEDDIVLYDGKKYRLLRGSYKFELLGFYNPSQDEPHDFFSENAYMIAEIIGNLHENPEMLKP